MLWTLTLTILTRVLLWRRPCDPVFPTRAARRGGRGTRSGGCRVRRRGSESVLLSSVSPGPPTADAEMVVSQGGSAGATLRLSRWEHRTAMGTGTKPVTSEGGGWKLTRLSPEDLSYLGAPWRWCPCSFQGPQGSPPSSLETA